MKADSKWLPTGITLATILAVGGGADALSLPAGDAAGGVVWRFRFATPFSNPHVAVGADGVVYAADNQRLYALSPAGEVLWTADGLGGGPVDFLADGRLVVGIGDRVMALDPADGSTLWTFTWDSNGLHEQIMYGPGVGPDGNVYGVTSTQDGFGLGAFSLTPLGTLRWNDEGSPPLDLINGSNDGHVFFTADQFFFPFNSVQGGLPAIYGFDLDGRQSVDPGQTCSGLPRTDELRLFVAGQCGLDAFDADTLNPLWNVQLGAVMLGPAVGSDGVAYTAAWSGPVSAVSPGGQVLWTSTGGSDAEQILGVSPDNTQVIYAHSASASSATGVRGLSTADGSVTWSVEMSPEDGHFELPSSKISAFSPDGTTVYFTTRYTSNGAPGALYAVHISTGPGAASCFGVGCPCANDDPAAGCANSTGSGALLRGSGSASVSADDLVLTATGLPTGQQGLFYMGDTVVSNPLWDGRQCALGTTFRFPASIRSSGAAGAMTYTGFVTESPAMIVSGTTWHFHCWHRDVPGTPCGTGANFSNLYSLTFTP